MVDQLCSQGRKEALSDGVVPAIALPAHALHDALVIKGFAVRGGGVGASPVGVVEKATRRFAAACGLAESLECEAGVVVRAGRPSDNTTGIQVEHHGQVQPVLASRDG